MQAQEGRKKAEAGMTPGGKLQAGDIVEYPSTKEQMLVLERLGNDPAYAVRVRPLGAGKNPKVLVITTAAYSLKRGHLRYVGRK